MQLPVCKRMYISMSYSYSKYEFPFLVLDSAGFMWTRTRMNARRRARGGRRETAALRLILQGVPHPHTTSSRSTRWVQRYMYKQYVDSIQDGAGGRLR
eukprot:COSAG02_NODE_8204_length_2662_cov_2.156067_2_plen_98_part_00